MLNWINRMFSDPQGIPDDGRVEAFMLVCAYIGITLWAVGVNHQAFDPQQFGIGAGAVAAGAGALYKLRGDK